MQALCSRREYCTVDIRRKVTDAGGDADEIIESLVGDGFLSDLRYATAFARDKSSIAGWGPVKIRYALSSKGIDPSTISSALEEIDAPSADTRLEKLLVAKYKSLKDDPQRRMKLIRFALGRGYEYDAIKGLLDRIVG